MAKQSPQDSVGTKYLKFMATNYSIVKLLQDDYKGKNVSLSGCPKIQELKNLRNDQLTKAQGGQGKKDEASAEPAMKKKRIGETVVNFEINGVEVSCLCPAKRAALSDLQIELQPAMISAVITALRAASKDEKKPEDPEKSEE